MIELKGTYNQDCKIFIDEVETEAIELVRNILNQEISAGVQVRIMPDTHVGKGIVIGFTMPVTRMVFRHHVQIKPANRKRTIPYTGPRHPAFHPHGNAYPKGKEFGRLVDYPLF